MKSTASIQKVPSLSFFTQNVDHLPVETKTRMDVPLEARIKGDRINGFFGTPNTNAIYKYVK